MRMIHAEIRWLREWVIPNAYFAFTGLVCSNQFAGLGVVLLGVLARVYRVIGGGQLGVSGDEEGEDMDNDVEEREVMVNYDRDETGDLGIMIVRREQELEVEVVEGRFMEIFGRKTGEMLMDGDRYGSPRKREEQSVPVQESSYLTRKGEEGKGGSRNLNIEFVLSQRNEGAEGHLDKENKFLFENAEGKTEIEVDRSIINNNTATTGTTATSKTLSGSELKKKKKKRNEIDELFAGLL